MQPARGDRHPGTTVIASLTNGNPWTRPVPHKVPPASAGFWLLTLLGATVGVTAADSLAAGLALGLPATTAVMSLVLAGMLIRQLAAGRCVLAHYWLVVVVSGVVGALFSDYLVTGVGLSDWPAVTLLGAAVVLVLTGWRLGEHTVSMDSVLSRRREAWYWGTLLCACALGPSIGDLLSGDLGLGHVVTVLVLAGALGVIAVGRSTLELSPGMVAWAAYVVTRSLGAALGAVLGAPRRDGGLGLGTNGTSVVLLAVILGAVALSGATRSARSRASS